MTILIIIILIIILQFIFPQSFYSQINILYTFNYVSNEKLL